MLFSFGELGKAAAAIRLAELQEAPGFDLANPFASDSVSARYFVKRAWMTIS